MLRIFEGANAMSVDNPNGSRTGVGRGRRHYDYMLTPTPLLQLDPDAIGAAVPLIAAAIHATRRKRTCGSYVFVGPAVDGRHPVHVLSEESHVATDWVRTHIGWLVALYHPLPEARPRLGPTVDFDTDRLGEDLADHLAGFR